MSATKDVKDSEVMVPTTTQFKSPLWPVWKRSRLQKITIDYHKPNQMVAPITLAPPGMVFLPEQIKISPTTWCIAIYLMNVSLFPPYLSIRIARSNLLSTSQASSILLPKEHINSPAPCHNSVHRDLDCLSLPQNITLVHDANQTQ